MYWFSQSLWCSWTIGTCFYKIFLPLTIIRGGKGPPLIETSACVLNSRSSSLVFTTRKAHFLLLQGMIPFGMHETFVAPTFQYFELSISSVGYIFPLGHVQFDYCESSFRTLRNMITPLVSSNSCSVTINSGSACTPSPTTAHVIDFMDTHCSVSASYTCMSTVLHVLVHV